MDLSKAFDCVPHNLLIAKLAAYSVDENLLMYLCILISQIESSVFTLIMYTTVSKMLFLGLPQGSIVSPTLFNCFFNYFFYFINKASLHNFADDDSLSMFESNIKNLKLIIARI